MAVSQFPCRPNVAFPSDPVGSAHLIWQDLPPEFVVAENTFKDGGGSTGMESTSAIILRFAIVLDGENPATVAIYDSHYAEAFGTHLPFAVRHPRTNVLYQGVKYESYNYPQHAYLNSQRREIVLVKRPA